MSIDAHEFRSCLGQFATGVTVVSCSIGGTIHGATVSAFMSVSLDPPLIAVSLDRRSRACRFLEHRPFAVSVLSCCAHDTALHFAGRPQADISIGWVPGHIAPTVRGALASFTCLPWATYDGGDHVLYIGEVQTMTRQPGDSPLLFHQGAFHRIGAHVAGMPWHITLDSPTAGTIWHANPQPTKETS